MLSTFAIVIVAALHLGFFVLESVLWTSPSVRRIFQTTQAEAQATEVLARNQGFYNLGTALMLLGFHATDNTGGVTGLLWFVVAMGVVGAVTANWRILLVQSLPAAVALWLVALA